MNPPIITALLLSLTAFGLSSCNGPSSQAQVITTPPNAKIDLSKVSLKISKAKLKMIDPNHYQLDFKYTLINKAGATLAFESIYSGKDELIQVNLNDKNGDPLFLGKRPLEGLTLASPRTMEIPKGKFSRVYTVPVMPELREKGDPITLRVRFHAPSRYDELRSTVEAQPLTIPWPQGPPIEAPDEAAAPDTGEYPLTSPAPDATPLPQR
ncbi:hypothetical protein HW115_15780 [Verrucomicrobiaceae bacterium N1E253]|uniref:Lipoprotein n=1 Tax=Oceaniferula marina TaxID=2748318 RepID=A0A851GJB0_9BACT|nr:hypothetical protein [Oceaniferula marina]NWK57082.1 hypothetical protein [Oceaniferula marina]